MVQVVMHFCELRQNQTKHAAAFRDVGVKTTPAHDDDADVHIVSGPHFAMPKWRGHPNLIMIDRAFYGDPEYVQMFWLNPDGSRTYASGDSPRYSPQLKPWKTGQEKTLVLADFRQEVDDIVEKVSRFSSVRVRRHPSENNTRPVPLADDLAWADVCIGHSSTALFEAIVSGVPVICTDPHNIVAEVSAPGLGSQLYRGDREAWLHRVSWAQWKHDEFGIALNHLLKLRGLT